MEFFVNFFSSLPRSSQSAKKTYFFSKNQINGKAVNQFKEVVWAKMVKIIKFLFFAQKESSGMGASHPKFLGG